MARNPIVGVRRSVPTWLALAVAAVGVALIVVALAAQVRAPEPPRSVGRIDPASPPASSTASPPKATGAAGGAAAGGGSASTGPTGKPAEKPLTASPPVQISIPSIGVRSEIKPIGLAQDGTLAVPQPGPDEDKAAWFENSPTPGQPGPAIIEGHVDTTSGPSVFFDLGKLRPGAEVLVTRADGVVAVFKVNAVRNYAKDRFPTGTVYGAKDLSRPALRLITCSNFDSALRTHTGNAVVFAELSSTRPRR